MTTATGEASTMMQEKGPNIPQAAFWDDDVWAVGQKDGTGKKIGDWVRFLGRLLDSLPQMER